MNVVWYRLRVSESQRHTPIKILPSTPPPPGVRHYWKRVPGWLCNLIACDVRGSPQLRFLENFDSRCYRRLRNPRRVFLRFGTVSSFRSIRGFIWFGKWRIVLTVRCKNWCQEMSAYKLVNKLFKVVFLALLAGVQNMREIMLIQWLQFRHKLLKERLTLIQQIKGCPAIPKIGVLSFGNLDKTPIKTLEFDAREFSSIGWSILLFASLEK